MIPSRSFHDIARQSTVPAPAIICLLLFVSVFFSSLRAGVFLSQSGFGAGASSSPAPTVNLSVGDPATLHVYWDTVAGGDISDGISLDFIPSATGVVNFTGATSVDADIQVGASGPVIGRRWGDYAGAGSGPQPPLNTGPLGDINSDSVVNYLDIAPIVSIFSGGGSSPNADVNMDGSVDLLDAAPFSALLPRSGFSPDVANLASFSITMGTGLLGANNGSGVFVDTRYDGTASAFYLGSFDFTAVAPGSIQISSQAGIGGIVNGGATVTPTFGAANVSVAGVPEPSQALLLLGSAGFLLVRRRRG